MGREEDIMFKKHVNIFRTLLKGKTVKRDGERWLFNGTIAHYGVLYASFVIPSRAKRNGDEPNHTEYIDMSNIKFWHECKERDPSYPVEFVPIEPGDEDRIQELIG